MEDVKLKSLATMNLWRQCVKCNHMIELSEGCYHMTCRCGCEFCYNCGAEWKNKKATCPCPLWREGNIIHSDEDISDDDMGFPLGESDEEESDYESDWQPVEEQVHRPRVHWGPDVEILGSEEEDQVVDGRGDNELSQGLGLSEDDNYFGILSDGDDYVSEEEVVDDYVSEEGVGNEEPEEGDELIVYEEEGDELIVYEEEDENGHDGDGVGVLSWEDDYYEYELEVVGDYSEDDPDAGDYYDDDWL